MKQFSEMSTQDAVETFEQIFKGALESLASDLARMPWYIRERQVVNLFVFHHLVPQFQRKDVDLDLGQIGIEIPIWVNPKTEKNKLGIYGDLVIWPHNYATNWYGCKPLAWVEWAHCGCREQTCKSKWDHHISDFKKLKRNPQSSLLRYAILTKRHQGKIKIHRRKVNGTDDGELTVYPRIGVIVSGDETPYKGDTPEIWKRGQTCEVCDTCKEYIQPNLSSRDLPDNQPQLVSD